MFYILLGAGSGTRMGALTRARPKILLEVDGQAILARNLDAIAHTDAGAETVIVTGYASDTVDAFLHGGRWQNVHTLWNLDFARAGPLRSLKLAFDALPIGTEHITIANGDTIFEAKALQILRASPFEIGLLCSPAGEGSDADDVQLKLEPDGIRAAAKGLALPGGAPISAGLLQVRGADAIAAVRVAISQGLTQEMDERRPLTWHSIIARLDKPIPQAVLVPHELWWEFDSPGCIDRYKARHGDERE